MGKSYKQKDRQYQKGNHNFVKPKKSKGKIKWRGLPISSSDENLDDLRGLN